MPPRLRDMPPTKLDLVQRKDSAANGTDGRIAQWYERVRDIVLRSPEPASRAYRYMSRLIDREFVRAEETGGICLAFTSPDTDRVSTDAMLMLAYCLRSELDCRVLLIDTQLREDSMGVADRLGLGGLKGFADYLRGDADDLATLIHATAVYGVEVLPAGVLEGRGTPLDRDHLRALLDLAKSRYDYVLLRVDSPERDTRAVITAIEARAVFLLVTENRTFMTILDECRKVLIDNGVKDVRVVVIGAKG